MLPPLEVSRVVHEREDVRSKGLEDHEPDVEGIHGTPEEVRVGAGVVEPLLGKAPPLNIAGEPFRIARELRLPVPHDDPEGRLQAEVDAAISPRGDDTLHIQNLPLWRDGIVRDDIAHGVPGAARHAIPLCRVTRSYMDARLRKLREHSRRGPLGDGRTEAGIRGQASLLSCLPRIDARGECGPKYARELALPRATGSPSPLA